MKNMELMVIEKLMEELQEKMGHGAEDFDERLGRKKPDLEVVKIKSEIEPGIEIESLGGEEEPEFEEMGDMSMMEEEDPSELLKKRIMKLRG